MEGAGPPPADSERIETLPKVIITQELVGEYRLSLNKFYYRLSQFINFLYTVKPVHVYNGHSPEGGGGGGTVIYGLYRYVPL